MTRGIVKQNTGNCSEINHLTPRQLEADLWPMKDQLGSVGRLRIPILGILILTLCGCEEILPKRTAGEKLYSRHCSKCHGVDGVGQTIQTMGESYADLVDDSWRYAGDAPGMRSVLSQDMVFDHPTFSQRLSSEEIKQIVDHVMVLRGERHQ